MQNKKQSELPQQLIDGEIFYKFDHDSHSSGSFVHVQVDPKGHLLYWSSVWWMNESKTAERYDSIRKRNATIGPSNNAVSLSATFGQSRRARYVSYQATKAVKESRDSLELMQVTDVRFGKYTKAPKHDSRIGRQLASFVDPPGEIESCYVTLVYGDDFADSDFLTFTASNSTAAQVWGEALTNIVKTQHMHYDDIMHFVSQLYAKILYGSNNSLTFEYQNIVPLFIHSKHDNDKLEENVNDLTDFYVRRFLECGNMTVDDLRESDAYSLYVLLTGRSEVRQIFSEIEMLPNGLAENRDSLEKDKKLTITWKQFENFLNNEQRDARLNIMQCPFYNEQSTKRLIQRYEPHKDLAQKHQLSFKGFLRYLLSEDNGILAKDYLDLRQDELKEPLSHYFINSSHNTYLRGKQIGGKSSTEMYRQVLLAGCRSVELDCWNGDNGEPIITHGPTILMYCGILSFKDVIEAIAESAFKTTDTPVILSFENHCNKKQQAKMAMYCKEILGDVLLSEPLASHPLTPGTPLPSPALLRRKILIKNKKLDSRVTHQSASVESTGSLPSVRSDPELRKHRSSSPLYFTGEGIGWGIGWTVCHTKEQETRKTRLKKRSRTTVVSLRSKDSESELSSSSVPKQDESLDIDPEKVAVCKELSDLINYSRARKFRSLEQAEEYFVIEERNMSSEIYSLSEVDAKDLQEEQAVALVDHNKRQITRIYPRNTKINSGNYIPQLHWNAGCQMAALNFQTDDVGLQLNLGLFELNGRCGYVLKPQFLREKSCCYFNPFETDAIENIIPNTITVQILSGQLLCQIPQDFSSSRVEVQMYGLACDTVKRTHWTKLVPNTSANTLYMDLHEEPFEFTKVVCPQLASLRLVVKDQSDCMLAQRVLPLVALRPGYRHVMLRSGCNRPLGLASLFVKITATDYVPEEHMELVNALSDPISAMKKLDYYANALADPIAHVNEQQRREQMLRPLMEEDDQCDNPVERQNIALGWRIA